MDRHSKMQAFLEIMNRVRDQYEEGLITDEEAVNAIIDRAYGQWLAIREEEHGYLKYMAC